MILLSSVDKFTIVGKDGRASMFVLKSNFIKFLEEGCSWGVDV